MRSASNLQDRPQGKRGKERMIGLTFRDVIKFGSDVSKDHDTHMMSIEISFERVHNMHFLLSSVRIWYLIKDVVRLTAVIFSFLK